MGIRNLFSRSRPPDSELQAWVKRSQMLAEIEDYPGYKLVMTLLENELNWCQEALEECSQEHLVELQAYSRALRFIRDYVLSTKATGERAYGILVDRMPEIKKGVEPQLKAYQDNLKAYEAAVYQALAPEIQGTDWNKLAQDDPAQWAVKMQRVQNVNGILNAIKQEQHKAAEAQEQERQVKMKSVVEESVRVLRDEIPGWNNEVYQKILKAGEGYGLKPEEVNNITDPRAIKILNDARLYRELQQAKPVVEKKVVTVPKVAKPGTAPDKGDKPDLWKEGMEKLKKTGKPQDALGLARMIIERG